MTRDTTIEKQQIVIGVFHRLVRSGVDYSTGYMYKEAGKSGFLSPRGAGDMIRNYYNSIITPEMVECISKLEDKTHDERIHCFQQEYGLCEREARLIIRYIRRRK